MIRRFFGIVIFTITVLTASFGQNVFGRNDIANWAQNIHDQGPKHASNALTKTDAFLSHLTPSAGKEIADRCLIDKSEILYRI